MGNLILNFLQEQGILIVLGLMVLEGILHQWVTSRRYRRMQAGIQSLTSAHGQGEIARQAGQATAGKSTETMYDKRTESVTGSVVEVRDNSRKRGRRTSRRQEPESVPVTMVHSQAVQSQPTETIIHGAAQSSQQDLDSQLLYLKQSLDRIAAGRDQKLEEEPRERRKLTPEEEGIIIDILREYLS